MKHSERSYIFRKLRTRSRISGTPEKPRLSVYRSLKHIFAQVIDDVTGKTLVAVSSNKKTFAKGTGIEKAAQVGNLLAKEALSKGIKTVVFDRGARIFHGRVKALADAAREAGLKF